MKMRVVWCGVWSAFFWLVFAGGPLMSSQEPAIAINTPLQAGQSGLPIDFSSNVLGALPDATTPTVSVNSLQTFVYQIGGTVPPAQALQLTSDGDPVSVYASTGNYSWISVSPTSGVTPAQMTVGIVPTGLAAGGYLGQITITAPGSTNGTLAVPVRLTVNSASSQPLPDLVVTSFTAPVTGMIGTAISGASATVTNSGAAAATAFRIEYYLSPHANVTTSDIDTGSGCQVSGLGVGSTFTCSANINIPSSLAAGVYYLAAIADPGGSITETNKSNNTLTSSAGPITVSAPAILQAQLVLTSFQAPTSGIVGGAISGVLMTVANNGAAAAPAFRVEYYLSRNSTVSLSDIDTGWGCDVPGLAVSASFRCTGSIGIPASLTPGTYYLAAIADSGLVVSQPSRSPNIRNNDNGPIVLAAQGVVSISAGGVAEPFTYTAGLSPGAWASIYGSNLAATTLSWSPALNQPIATTLGGTTVKVNGIPAPISYVSPSQVNILIPGNAGTGPASLVLSNAMGSSGYSALSVQYLPAIYCNAVPGAVPVRFSVTAVDPATGEYVGNSATDARIARPARPGETIDLYAVGLGPPSGNQFPTSTLFSAAYPIPLNFDIVLGGVPVAPVYAALVSPGLYQVRFTVPSTAASGDQPVYLDFGASQSSQSVYLTVKP